MSRIEANSDEDRLGLTLSGHVGNLPFLLRRNAHEFRVEKRQYYKKTYRYLYAHIEPTAYGSRICGRFAIGKFQRGFMICWFAFLGLFSMFAIPGILSQYVRGEIGAKGLLWILHPIGMLLFGYLILALGKFLSRTEVSAITVWLHDLFADVTLHAPDEAAQPPAPGGGADRLPTFTGRTIPAKTSYRNYLLVWGALVVIIALVVGNINCRPLYHLATRGRRVQATVTALHAEDHNTVRYRYRVQGRTFNGQTQSQAPNPPLEQLRVGQTIVAYYDPAQPDSSVLGDPQPILHNEIIAALLAALFIPSVIVLSWFGHDRW